MARARNIKPAFFTNEDLVGLPFEARLLFIGLWTVADREGRLEDRPVKIKMELFPADNVNVDELLDQLQTSGFIARYRDLSGEGANSKKSQYIQIHEFVKHQRPHHQEAASVLPSPDDLRTESEINGVNRSDSLSSDSLSSDSLSSDCLCGEPPSNPDNSGLRTQVPGSKSCMAPPSWTPEAILPGQAKIDPGVDLDLELTMFRLHEFAQPKSNWQAAWLQWVSRAKPRKDPRQTPGQSTIAAAKEFLDG